MSTQPILAFDCACVGGSVALRVNGNTHTQPLTQTREAAELVPAIDVLMKSSGVAYADLGAIVTTLGPGSFTGVRIGLATLHGLALAHETPIKTITTLEAMAWAVVLRPNAPEAFHIAIRAGKGEVYAQRFRVLDGQPQADDQIYLLSETYAAWDAPCFGNHQVATDIHYLHGPDATMLCEVAAHLPTLPLTQALPVYIRPPDAIVGAPMPWLVQN